MGKSRAVLWGWLAAALWLITLATPTQAQTLKDKLKDHVSDSLRDDKKKDSKKKPSKKKPSKKPAARDKTPKGESLFSFSTEDDGEEAEPEPPPKKKKGPKLPVRVFGDSLKLDIKIGGGYRGWYPQQYQNVDVEVGSYYTTTIEVKAKIFKFLNLRRGYYESNSLAGPRTKEAAVAAQVGSYAPKAAWLLGVLGFPIFKVWEPVIKYETRAFDTRATPRADVCVVPRRAASDLENCVGTSEPLKITAGFETLVAGVRYNHSKDNSPVIHAPKGKVPPIFFGVGLMSYRKPYQLNIAGNTLDEFLFDGRFKGAGLALGTDLGGGLDNFFGNIDAQLGLGEVSLTEDLALNDLAPEGWLVGYVQGTGTVGYRWPFIRAAPTLTLVPTISAGGAYFFFFNTDLDEGERGDSPPVNWDFLWSGRLSLVVPL